MEFKKFELANRFRALNRGAQLTLFILACVLSFVVAWGRLPVWDVSADGRHSITPETTAYLQNLPTEVELIGSLALSEESGLGQEHFRRLEALVARYAKVSSKLKVRWIDGYRAQAEYGFENPYRLLLRTPGHQEWIEAAELWKRDATSETFLGERVLTSALWRVANPVTRKVVVVADSERWGSLAPIGFGKLADNLKRQGMTVGLLGTELTRESLQGADAVMILGQSDKLSAASLAALQRYLADQTGALFIALEQTPSDDFVRFLYYNGIEWTHARIVEESVTHKTPMGEVLFKDFTEHPMMQGMARLGQIVMSRGYWWQLGARGGLIDRAVEPLILSSLGSRADGAASVLPPPYAVAVAVERKAVNSTKASGAERWVVVGGADWLTNAYLGYRGNQAFAEAGLDWLMGRFSLQSIPVRSVQARQVSLTTLQLWQLGGIVGGAVVILGALCLIRYILRPR